MARSMRTQRVSTPRENLGSPPAAPTVQSVTYDSVTIEWTAVQYRVRHKKTLSINVSVRSTNIRL